MPSYRIIIAPPEVPSSTYLWEAYVEDVSADTRGFTHIARGDSSSEQQARKDAELVVRRHRRADLIKKQPPQAGLIDYNYDPGDGGTK
jgi:hypothetical protein